MVGTAGVLVPPPGYLQGVRDLCDKYGIVYIADEVMAGFGRTGEWLAIDHWDVNPDLIIFAKGSNSGYVPLGGVIISDEIAATFDERVFPGGLTYCGHPLACASALATITAMRDEGIVEHAAEIGEDGASDPACANWRRSHPVIGEVRGLGVFWALDLVADRATRRAAGAVGGHQRGDGCADCGVRVPRPAAVRQLQPAARGAAVRGHRRRGARGPGDPGRGARRGGPLLRRLSCGATVRWEWR